MPRQSDSTLSAIKGAIDIVSLVGEYLPLRRAGSRYKALCPFHDDHNPSLELNPERQSFKCWSCGAGGDIFDFVKGIERIEFPEALRILADRAGIALETRSAEEGSGLSKSELFRVNEWARGFFESELAVSAEGARYLESRGITTGTGRRFHLGLSGERGRLQSMARVQGFSLELLESAGLLARGDEPGAGLRERFRGRLIFPIHDDRGRVVGFGGRILPRVEEDLAARGQRVAKYLNSPETSIFHKRSLLYGADLAKAACREAGYVAVVEGYTDVIAAHQAGLRNVVGTLGTAFGEEHLRQLRRLAERVVLIFDGDEAGLAAADRALELFLASDLDLRVLALPEGLDPCDLLNQQGSVAFRELIDRAVDPATYVLDRAVGRFDVESPEGSRRAAEWVFGLLNRVPAAHRLGVELKQAKVIDLLSQRLRVPLETLNRLRRKLVQATDRRRVSPVSWSEPQAAAPQVDVLRIRVEELDKTDLELVRIVLNEPTAAEILLPRVAAASLRDPVLREILQACHDLYAQDLTPSYENLMLRLVDPSVRAFLTGLIAPTPLRSPDAAPEPERAVPAAWRERLEKMLDVLDRREWRNRLADLKRAREETDKLADPVAYRAIELEYLRLLTSGRTQKA